MARMSVFIENEEYKYFTNVSVALKYDSVASTFSISSNFIGNESQRETLKPLTYKKVQIYVGETIDANLILTGIILVHEFTSKSEPDGVKISGYSLPGVLADCEIPTEVYPLQDNNKTLKEITQKIIKPFGLKLFVNQIAKFDANKVIEQIAANETENAAQYITKMASQFNIIVGHSRRGKLLFTRVRANEPPLSNYVEGNGDYQAVSMKVNGQAMHNRYTVLRQPSFTDATDANPEESVNNSLVPIFRPKIKKQTVGDTDATPNAAKSARMRGLAAGVTFTIEVTTLLYQDGSIIKPNRIVTLTAPSIYIKDKISIFVKDVTLNQTPTGESAILTCVLKEALTGGPAQNIF